MIPGSQISWLLFWCADPYVPLRVLNPLGLGRWAVGVWGSISRGRSPQASYLPGAAPPVQGSRASCSLQNDQQRALWEHVQGSRERSDSEPEGNFILQTQTIILQLSKQTPRQETWLTQGHPASARRAEVTLHRLAFSALLWSCQHRISRPPVGAAAFSRRDPFCQAPHSLFLVPVASEKESRFWKQGKAHNALLLPQWSLRKYSTLLTNSYQLLGTSWVPNTMHYRFHPQSRNVCRFNFSVSSGSPFLIITPLKEISPRIHFLPNHSTWFIPTQF